MSFESNIVPVPGFFERHLDAFFRKTLSLGSMAALMAVIFKTSALVAALFTLIPVALCEVGYTLLEGLAELQVFSKATAHFLSLGWTVLVTLAFLIPATLLGFVNLVGIVMVLLNGLILSYLCWRAATAD